MKIYFGSDKYDLLHASYELDAQGVPVDIVLYSNDIETLQTILDKYGIIGYNLQFNDTMGCYEALYGRLKPFTIEQVKKNVELEKRYLSLKCAHANLISMLLQDPKTNQDIKNMIETSYPGITERLENVSNICEYFE